MRIMFVLAASIAANLPLAAQAAVSDDLVFCSNLTSPRERIACYDAAARIAANSSRRSDTGLRAARPPLVTKPVADHAAPPATYDALPSRSGFEGFYAALGAGYGITGPRQVSILGTTFFSPGMAETTYSSGWSVAGMAGYNITLGRFLFGLEVDGRFSNERGHAETSFAQTPPSVGTEFFGYDIKSDAGAHLSARIGATFDNTLLFAKLGAGASHIIESAFVDGRNTAGCLPAVPPVCFPGSLRTGSKSAWVPSYVFGVGLEHNFRPIFVRAQGELEAAQLQETRLFANGTATSDLYWTARAMAAVGVRF